MGHSPLPARWGSIFELSSGRTLTSLFGFDQTDGSTPDGGLVQGTDGNFYGTTESGGPGVYNTGTIFSVSTGLGPFVKTLPTAGKVGSAVKILGTDLTGASGVTFNGTPSGFTVVSASEITTSVPAGATGGKVQVTAPAGTLFSNVAFRVRQ